LTDILLKIIEEFSDGFLIINGERKIVFFNEVLLKTVGLRASDVFSREAEFLRDLAVFDGKQGEHEEEIEDRNGVVRRLSVFSLPVESENGEYLLVRIKAIQELDAEDGERTRQWEQLFNNLGDPVLTVDLSGRIKAANPSFFRLVGLEPGESLPNISELYVYSAELEDKILRLTESDTISNHETHLRTPSKELIRVLDTAWVIRDESDAVKGYTSHLKDITYIKSLEARLKISERNYMLLFDTMLSSIIIVDPAGAILNCNYYAEQLYGYTWAEIVGKNFSEVFQIQGGVPSISEIIARVKKSKGGFVQTDIPRRCKDGTIKFTYASYAALTSTLGETLAYSIMEKDLTERVRLEKKLQESFQKIKSTQSAAILGFARLTEYRDKDTGKHLERIREYTRVLALGLSRMPKYSQYITTGYIDDLCLSSVLHDVGKVGIEDAILLKPGKLSLQEFERIKQHAELGGEALRSVDREINDQSFLTIGKEIAFSHHERWDGTGYPAGKRGEAIPLSARIVALADVYDALTSKRSYKDSLTHEEAMKIICSERASHFDPDIVDVFVENHEVFNRIRMLESFREHPLSIDDLLRPKPGGMTREAGQAPHRAAEAGEPAKRS
jgi:PAS domain S-box-containing protein